ncbi:MAG: PAS domain S-box protein, partial [Anaerolineae bacterium]|nr:PAS domain S-box protein [Anaerolineae bacterium]
MRILPRTRPRISVSVKLLLAVLAILLVIIATQSWLTARSTRLRVQSDASQAAFALYNSYRDDVHVMERAAAALADSFAARPDVQEMVSAQNRQGLIELLAPIYDTLHARYAISHLYIHRPNGYVLVRVHDPAYYGDSIMAYRRANVAALTIRQTVAGVELDPDRLGVRGIAPILRQSELLGLVEVGLDYDERFIQDLKTRNQADYRLWITYKAAAPTGLWPRGDEPSSPSKQLFYYASTHDHPFPIAETTYLQALEGKSKVEFVSADDQAWAVLVAPMYAYGERIIGVVEIATLHTADVAALRRSQMINIAVIGGVALLTMALMGLAAELVVLRTLRHLTGVAHRQIEGDLTARVERLPRDELGELGDTFNRLTDQLNESIRDLERQIQISRQAQQDLQISTEELDRFFTVTLDLLCIADTDGYFRRVNPEWERTLGYRMDDLVGCRFLDLVHPDDIPATLKAIQDLSENKTVLNFANRYRCQDGSYRWIEWRSYPAGKLIYAAARDITERKQAEEALRASEDKFSTAFRTSPDSININRLSDGLYLEVNQGFTDLTGYSSEDVRGKTSLDINIWANPEDRARLVKGLREHGRVNNLEAQFRLKSGEVRTGLMSARMIQTGNEPCILSITRDITERRRAENVLKESEEKYRSIVEKSYDGILLVDEQCIIIEWNQALASLTGLTWAEAVGQFAWDVLCQFAAGAPEVSTSERLRLLRTSMEQLTKTGQAPWLGKTIEVTIRRPDGVVRTVLESNFPIETERGFMRGSIFRDITERKEAEDALRKAEEKYRHIFEHAIEAITQTTPEGQYITANPATAHMLGYDSPEELIASFSDLDRQFYVEPGRRETFKQLMQEHETISNFESEVYRKDGSTQWISENSHAVLDEDGVLVRYEGSAIDITERKRAEEALRESEERYRLLAEAAHDLIFVINREGNVDYVNNFAAQQVGCLPEEIIGRFHTELFMSDDTEHQQLNLCQVFKAGQPLYVENPTWFPNRRMWLGTWLVPIEDETGQVESILGVSRDITERKKAEEQVHQLNAELERRVVERTAQLEAANQELEAFAYSVSHDLRAPLRAMDGFSQALQEDCGDRVGEVGQGYIVRIRAAAQRMSELIDGLLQLARITRGELNITPIDLSDLAGQIA